VAFVFDWDGNRLEKYTYDAFGWPTVVSWTGAAWDDAHPRSWSNYGNRFMFNGREFFAEMGVMDYRHRFYHPALGRFLQADPTGFDAGDMNLFRYCGDDPVDRSDPTGLLDTNASLWKMNCYFDSGNSAQGGYNDFMGYRPQAGMDGGGLVRWSDEGNRNQHEPVVKGKDGKSYNALTEPELKVTAADGVISAHYIINVRYSDKVGPHNKERQKLEPDHGNEIDNEFRYNRGPKAIEHLTRPGGPLEGKSLETQRSMVEHVLRVPFESAVEATRERHDNLNPLKGPIGDHPIIHPDGLNY
jgi:RHS repeat-associated protein